MSFSSRAVVQGLRAVPRAATAGSRMAVAAHGRRGYAAAVDSKPPVALYGIDGTYASALYTAAAKQQTLDPVAKALSTLQGTFQKDTKLAQILASPTLSSEDKSQMVTELLKASGAGQEATVKNFLQTLADNNRLGALEGVCAKFEELMSAARGEVELRVTSAAPLDAKVLKQLESAVGKSQYVGQGKKLKTVAKVNSDIRGGLIVEIGDRTIDLSVSSKLARMNKLLRDTL